jgi:tyrosine-protein phosphatase SIW14
VKSICAVPLALALAVAALAQTPVRPADLRSPHIANFRRINRNLYAGAQPRLGCPGHDGIAELAELGIRTIIDLQTAGRDERQERLEAQGLGLAFYSIPLPGLGAPPAGSVARAEAIINDPSCWPVFVHCKHGQDRTGTIVAIYRIEHDGWPDYLAIAEMRAYHDSWIEFGMRRFVRRYYARRSLRV